MSVEAHQILAPLPVAPPQQPERPDDEAPAFRALLSHRPATEPATTASPGAAGAAATTGEDRAASASPAAESPTLNKAAPDQPGAPTPLASAAGQAATVTGTFPETGPDSPAGLAGVAATAGGGQATTGDSAAAPAATPTAAPAATPTAAAPSAPPTAATPATMVAPATSTNTNGNPAAARAKSAAQASGPATGLQARVERATGGITPRATAAGSETGSAAAGLLSAAEPEPDSEIEIAASINADGATPANPSTAHAAIPAGDGTTTSANRIAAGAVSGGERLGFTAIFPSSPPATGSEALTPALATLAQFASDGEGTGLHETDPITGIPTMTATAGGSTAAGVSVAAPVNTATVSAQPLAQQVAMQIVRAADQGIDHIRIRLHPHQLGRVDVRLEVGHDGRVQAVLTAEKAETLDLMRRDADQLQRALADGGLKADSGSLDFSLARHHDGAPPDHADTPAASATTATGDAGPEPGDQAALASRSLSAAAGALDIRV